MPKAMRLFLVVCIALIALTGCAVEGTNPIKKSVNESDLAPSSTPIVPKVENAIMTAEEIITAMKKTCTTVGKIVVYDERTDRNGLLGLPNQYTSKVNFADTRLAQGDESMVPVGGTLEVFNNAADAQARQDYIKALTVSSSANQQYFFLYDNVLLRIDRQLSRSQAEEYGNTLNVLKYGERASTIN